MTRLTRVERQAQTRAEVLQAAKTRFLAMGYAATTLEDIAEDAGYSKGAVYSNFQDKPTLCWEALDLIHREKMAEIEAIITVGASLNDRLSPMVQWLEKTLGDVGWTMLEYEFVVLSRHDSRLTQMVAELRQGWHRMAATLVRELVEGLGVAADEIAAMEQFIEDTADIVLSTGIGLSVQRAMDPTMAARTVDDMVQGFVGFVKARFGVNDEEMRRFVSGGFGQDDDEA